MKALTQGHIELCALKAMQYLRKSGLGKLLSLSWHLMLLHICTLNFPVSEQSGQQKASVGKCKQVSVMTYR